MKAYPSIPRLTVDSPQIGQPCIAFHKYDGSNIRAEWSKKAGWYKFGTRTRLFDENDPEYAAAIPLFLDKYGDSLPKAVKGDRLIAYAEFFGAKSFAGQHLPGDPKQVVLFDVSVHKQGFLSPRQFLDQLGPLGVAAPLYFGTLTPEFVLAVEDGLYGADEEGVIVKGGERHGLWYGKIKTKAYLEKLKKVYADRWKDFW